MKPFLSIIIPTYNESERIFNTLLEIDHYLSSINFNNLISSYITEKGRDGYEIIVVDDGSSDNTPLIVKSCQKKIKHLRIIENGENRGKGFVVREGMLEARGKIRIFTDADNSTSIDHIEKMLPYFYDDNKDKICYQVVVGSRAIKGSKIAEHQPLYREILGKLGNKFIQVIAVWGITDTQCGFKGFEENAAASIFENVTICRWGFDIEAMAIARFLNYKIKEIPVIWVHKPFSRINPKDYFQVLWDTLKIRLNIWLGKYNF